MERTNWIRKLATADLRYSKLRSMMTIFAVIIITTLSSSCVIVYLSLLNSMDKMIVGDVNYSVGFYIFLIIPVVFCGFLLITDCFHLNKENAIKQIGLMTSIGLTKKQNRSILRWQTFYLTSIGFAVSIFLTLILIYLVLPASIKDIFKDFHIVGLPIILLVLTISGIITMGLVNAGLYISYYNSEELTVSEKIKYTNHLPYRQRSGKNNNNTQIAPSYPKRWLNKTMLAGKNYIRNIKNNSHVLASLIFALGTLLMVNVIVSGINVMAFADTFVGNNDYKLYNKTFAEDYKDKGSVEELLYGQTTLYKSPAVNVFDEKFVSRIKDNNKIHSVKIIKTVNMSYIDSEDHSKQFYDDYFDVVDSDYVLSRFSDEDKPDADIMKKFEEGKIALMPFYDDGCYNMEFKISGSIMEEGLIGESYDKATDKNKFEFDVYSINKDPSEGSPDINPGFYIHENVLKSVDVVPIISSIEFSADKKDRPSVQRFVDKNVADNELIGSESRDRYAALAQAQKDAFFLIGYLLAIILVIISFIGFAIVNVVSMDARKHEFFVLKCVGMSRHEIKFMLLTEGIIYGIVVLLIMSIIVNSLIFFLYNNFKMYYNTYHFPIILFAVIMVVTIAIVILIPVIIYLKNSIKKNQIISQRH